MAALPLSAFFSQQIQSNSIPVCSNYCQGLVKKESSLALSGICLKFSLLLQSGISIKNCHLKKGFSTIVHQASGYPLFQDTILTLLYRMLHNLSKLNHYIVILVSKRC